MLGPLGQLVDSAASRIEVHVASSSSGDLAGCAAPGEPLSSSSALGSLRTGVSLGTLLTCAALYALGSALPLWSLGSCGPLGAHKVHALAFGREALASPYVQVAVAVDDVALAGIGCAEVLRQIGVRGYLPSDLDPLSIGSRWALRPLGSALALGSLGPFRSLCP
ncbi:hypothetical protein [Corynebacterium heidelbergense]|uniref:hypothetical protein n=1 Tax=Corynebacterium heidelbergense TaxID=2055947 RepID=UPI001EE6AEBB|nr:hypothetical protein [Corynebacterium heidelbergense]